MAKRRMLELRVAAAPAGEDDVKTLDDIIDGLRVEIKQAGLHFISIVFFISLALDTKERNTVFQSSALCYIFCC